MKEVGYDLMIFADNLFCEAVKQCFLEGKVEGYDCVVADI
jgi:hypothetical protein